MEDEIATLHTRLTKGAELLWTRERQRHMDEEYQRYLTHYHTLLSEYETRCALAAQEVTQ